MKTEKTHYDTMGVARDATQDEIRAAYKSKRGALHPDREGGDPEAMAALNAAWTVLGDPAARAEYDAKLPDIEREARELMAAMLNKASEFDGDILEQSQTLIDSKRSEVQAQLDKAKEEVERTERHIKRLKRKHDTKADLLGVVLQGRLAKLGQFIEAHERLLELFKRIEAMLGGYDYEMPEDERINYANKDQQQTMEALVSEMFGRGNRGGFYYGATGG